MQIRRILASNEDFSHAPILKENHLIAKLRHLQFLVEAENFEFTDSDKISKYCISSLGHNASDVRVNSYLVLLYLAKKSRITSNVMKLLRPVNLEIFENSKLIF